LVGGFYVDVNFTQLADSNSTQMSMQIETPIESPVSNYICQGFVKLVAPNKHERCNDIVVGDVNGFIVATINKPSKFYFIFIFWIGHMSVFIDSIFSAKNPN
jgi:hypothetical protein